MNEKNVFILLPHIPSLIALSLRLYMRLHSYIQTEQLIFSHIKSGI